MARWGCLFVVVWYVGGYFWVDWFVVLREGVVIYDGLFDEIDVFFLVM